MRLKEVLETEAYLLIYSFISHWSYSSVFCCSFFFAFTQEFVYIYICQKCINGGPGYFMPATSTTMPALPDNLSSLTKVCLCCWVLWTGLPLAHRGLHIEHVFGCERGKHHGGVFFIWLRHYNQPKDGLKKISASQGQSGLAKDTLLNLSSRDHELGDMMVRKMRFEIWMPVRCYVVL